MIDKSEYVNTINFCFANIIGLQPSNILIYEKHPNYISVSIDDKKVPLINNSPQVRGVQVLFDILEAFSSHFPGYGLESYYFRAGLVLLYYHDEIINSKDSQVKALKLLGTTTKSPTDSNIRFLQKCLEKIININRNKYQTLRGAICI